MKCSDFSWEDQDPMHREFRDFAVGDLVWNPKGGEAHIITHTETVRYWGSMYDIDELRCECGGLDIDHHVFMLRKGVV